VITPRQTRLVRVPHLAGFRAALTDRIGALDPIGASDTFVIVPTRAAGEQLRRTIEDRLLSAERQAIAWPGVGPRSDFYRDLASRSERAIDVLSPFDREVLLGRVAREVAAEGTAPPFAVRPALVAEMLALYDHIRRQARTIEDFDRNLRAELEPSVESDRGAVALLAQTAFLSAIFKGYQSRLAQSGLADEHVARAAMLSSQPRRPLLHAIVAVADRVADPEGLWPVDFTLLSMLPGLAGIEIIATENMVAAGFLERVHAALPGIVEETWQAKGLGEGETTWPTLVVPGMDGPQVFESRDREEELAAIARRFKAERRAGISTPLHRTALVVRRPLPYLYLARSVFGNAGIPFETLDTLPLAAEPYASALDLVLDFVASGYARGAAVALLRSPHFRFDHQGAPLKAESISALDRTLADARYLGGEDRLARLIGEWAAIVMPATREERRRHRASPAAQVLGVLARELGPLADQRPIPSQLRLLQTFLGRHHREPEGGVDQVRLERVRRAVWHAIETLSSAYQAHDPEATASVTEISAAIRRWLGAQTFAAPTGARGLQILDAEAARFADVDDVQLVGLVEGEWPERVRRNIFYPPFLLNVLEPSPAADDPNRRESDARRAARASFWDLLTLARDRVRVSTFALESDAVVEPSAFVDDLSASGLTREVAASRPPLRVFVDEALSRPPVVLDGLPPMAEAWAKLRLERPNVPDPRFRGEAGPWIFPRISVSRVDRYLKCPFQFFASEVLELEEEPGDEDLPPPWERGRFLHAIFETFFREWQALGHGRVTPDLLPDARALLVEISESALAGMPPAEAALERLRLRGSAASAGIIDRVLSMEADRDDEITRRLIEYSLDDVFVFRSEDGATRAVPLRAKIDRVDLLADGSFRVIDYKSRLLPDLKQTVQLQVYTAAVAQQLQESSGKRPAPREAFYLSMEGEPPIRAIRPARGQTLDDVLKAAETRLVQALDDIGAGHFPPRPVPRSLCRLCPFDAVCRKAFVEAGDE
jgi:RecB family exonuclease